ncbi:MAG TPA: glycosyl hydrolase, partial [Roseiflexaceae bacterium]|nr:glycosyl hydrolase [Roseiflexaceae bacterium]
MELTELHAHFADPPRPFGVIPFWFWNDDLDETELLRQIRAFHEKGFGGFLPHPRIGLSRRVGYLTDEYFRLVRIAVDEAARLGMQVVLYDEGSYPSGSAQGRVVAENPEYASRCLIALQHSVDGPARGFWHPNPGRALGDKLLGVVLARETAPGILHPDSLTWLDVLEPELVAYDVPEGAWRLLAIWNVASGGAIRGVFEEEEDQHASAPPAGDLLNPDAVACFIRHTHEQYYTHLRDHFGQTVVAMFTDEPMLMGRGARRGPNPWPYTGGFLDELQPAWDGDVRLWLAALWLDCGPRTAAFRQTYRRVIHERLERVFYGAQRAWCSAHGIALTGHPAESNELRALRQFQWPGQDMVWRWVVPGAETALTGPHSCAPKVASSAAALQGSQRNASEVLGAYGWRLTLDEAKWLLDWHLVRGNNLFFLHACFYSIRGRRAFESEPDIGLHNVWWPSFQLIGDYLRRLCWLLSDGREVCDVAVLTEPNHAAWEAARVLYQNQIDFLYIDDEALAGATMAADGRLQLGPQLFRAVVCDPPRENSHPLLDRFAAAGGVVLTNTPLEQLVEALAARIGRDVDWPGAPDVRVLHYRKNKHDLYLFVNEGEHALDGHLSLGVAGALQLWDALNGSAQPWPGTTIDGRTHTQLRLERRQSLVLAVDPTHSADASPAMPPQPGEVVLELAGAWSAFDEEGRAVAIECPGDWSRQSGWETFAGQVLLQTRFTLSAEQARDAIFLDL